MKSTKITAPQGYEIDRDKSTFDEIVFKPVKKEFAQSWEELGMVKGYCIDLLSCILKHHIITDKHNANVLPPKPKPNQHSQWHSYLS